ncbi:MAG: DoxX family membrane protein, partial [Bacteroidales bacterium]|nr:DoxX family membrane protein [Bacteroidales bacterium]
MKTLTKATRWFLTLTRLVIGWHFLYEGIAKILAGNWSSAPYLTGSKWILAPLFSALAHNESVVAIVDFINIWGMILVGLGLILGLFIRWASAGGALMLLLYFLAYPPIPGYMFGIPTDGNYLWVNRNLIEFFMLASFIFIPSYYQFGLDRLYARWREEKARQPAPDDPALQEGRGRREMLRDLISDHAASHVCLCLPEGPDR